jgi:anti-sigma factor RsiW
MSDAPVDPRLIVHAYLDGELDAAGQLAFERTLAGDPVLAQDYERLAVLRRTLREKLPRTMAPASLAGRLERLSVTEREGAQPGAAGFAEHRRTERPDTPVSGQRGGRAGIAMLGMAASVALGIAIGGVSTWWTIGRNPPMLVDELISDHRRALLAGAPVDIASNDRHNVRPWFDARIAVSPPAPDLAARGFPLAGGRIDVVDGMPAPTLVYRIREHFVSVTALPASEALTTGAPSGGYRVFSWRGPQFTFWAVTDADLPQFETFVAAFKAAAESGTETAPK